MTANEKDRPMDAFIFNQRVKHGRLDFHPTVVYGFEDPDAAPYFAACGWGETTDADVAVPIGIDELDIDPCTVWGNGENRGKFVMPERAAEARGISLEEAQAYAWDGSEVLIKGGVN
jgi:hypothetical protein